MSFFEPVAALAATQHGTISRAQLIRIGVSPRQIRTLTSNGMLERLAPALYTLAGSSDTWERRLAVGLHRAGPLALVGARSASALWRLDRFRPGHVDLLGFWQGARTSTGVRVHRTIDLPTRDRTVLDHLPVTTPTRTLIDMGRYVGAGRLGKMMDDAVHRDLTTYEELHQRCGELARSGRNGIATVQEALADRPGGAVAPGSDFERQVRTLLTEAGLPAPVLQHPVTCGLITYLLDLAWPDQLVAVECDGFRFHRMPGQLEWDDQRRNELGLRGWLVHHVTWRMLHDDPAGLVSGVRRALASRSSA